MILTLAQLMACTGCASEPIARGALPGIDGACADYEINTVARLGMFLANVGHESGGLRFRREIWGPTRAQQRYEIRRDLGNVRTGDGRRFMGRGYMQTTGRGNYARLRDRLRVRWPERHIPDFEEVPQLLEIDPWVAVSAADYWEMQGLSALADYGDFDGVCDRINIGHATASVGDSNGYEHRLALWEAGRDALSVRATP